jgi:DNA-3-methyladenine glycosylase II
MASHKHKLAHLSKSDPVLRKVIKKIKLRNRARRDDYFESLVVAIVNQQLSGKAAATILKRFVALFPGRGKKFPTPKQVLKMPVPKMRKAGLSKMKVSFLKDLSKKFLDGTVDVKKIDTWSDEEVIEHLTAVKGIGRWTAEMFLMFSLARDDVFSYGDLGLRNAIQRLYGLRKNPSPAQAEKISSKWKPYRTLASLYLWASVDEA